MLWVKALHVIFVISWMAGLLYLPRLLVYHFDAEPGSAQSDTFRQMEGRLLRLIMTPAMIGTWLFGLWTAHMLAVWEDGWFVTKVFLVVLMTFFHFVQAKWVREFAVGERKRSQRFYRIANEIPAVLMIGIVILAVVKPF